MNEKNGSNKILYIIIASLTIGIIVMGIIMFANNKKNNQNSIQNPMNSQMVPGGTTEFRPLGEDGKPVQGGTLTLAPQE